MHDHTIIESPCCYHTVVSKDTIRRFAAQQTFESKLLKFLLKLCFNYSLFKCMTIFQNLYTRHKLRNKKNDTISTLEWGSNRITNAARKPNTTYDNTIKSHSSSLRNDQNTKTQNVRNILLYQIYTLSTKTATWFCSLTTYSSSRTLPLEYAVCTVAGTTLNTLHTDE